MEKLVAILIAFQGFQPIEYEDTKKEIERAGFHVVTISNKKGQAISSNGSAVHVDATVVEFNPLDYAAVVCIGGPGALDALDTPLVQTKLRQAHDAGVIVGAICIAPRILAHAGILADKLATGWDDDKALTKIFNQHKVTYKKGQPVVVDGKVITATGPLAAQEFGKKIGTLLSNVPSLKK